MRPVMLRDHSRGMAGRCSFRCSNAGLNVTGQWRHVDRAFVCAATQTAAETRVKELA